MSLTRRLVRAILQFIGLLTVIGLLAALLALPLLPRILQVEDKVTKADYILPLAGEWHRFLRAAEFYKSGLAPKVLVSNAKDRKPSRFNAVLEDMGIDIPTRSQLRRRILIHLGVPESALKEFGSGHISTAEEAEALRAFLGARSTGQSVSIILVTSPYHTRRAKMIFSDVMPDARFMVTSPPEGKLEARWWTDRTSAITSVLETIKFVHYLFGGRFRNSDSTP